MTRGTFANIRLKNLMVPGVEGGYTRHLPGGEQMTIFDAAMKYKMDRIPLVILAGKEYGTGSSRDWAAKGTLLLGVKAVIAESFERIHRSNLAGTVYDGGLSAEDDAVVINPPTDPLVGENHGFWFFEDGGEFTFQVIARLDTPIELEYYRNGGILQTVLYKRLAEKA
jgi:aconitate hydratase